MTHFRRNYPEVPQFYSAPMPGAVLLRPLQIAMDKLKPEYREVITLTKIEGLSYKDAASRLGKGPDAVRMLLARAITALNQSFEKTE